MPSDTVDARYGLSNLCGEKIYEIIDSSGTTITSWAYIIDSQETVGSKAILVDTVKYPEPIDEDIELRLTLVVRFDGYPQASSEAELTVQVTKVPDGI